MQTHYLFLAVILGIHQLFTDNKSISIILHKKIHILKLNLIRYIIKIIYIENQIHRK